MRPTNCVQMWRFSAMGRADQPAISFKLRQQPSHSCDVLDMRHTDTQGEGTSSEVAMDCAFLSKRSAAGGKRVDAGMGLFRQELLVVRIVDAMKR